MPFLEFPKRLLAIAETLAQWGGAIAALDQRRRAKVARYADAIAGTLGRAAAFADRLTEAPEDAAARRGLKRELGRMAGYLETLVGVLKHHLDGRKLAGVKRRLEQLGPGRGGLRAAHGLRIDRLLAAEGYFRALADSLRA
ncbi:MAG: hypothetical protein ABUL43_00265 [Hyphomicrobium sp.]